MALVIDIETLDLLHKIPLPEITCICMYDVEEKQQYKLQFWKISPEEKKRNTEIVVSLLDSAKCIIGYNIVLFDLEFIKCSFQINESKLTSWVLKSIDLFMMQKFILKNSCSLNELLKINQLSCKTDCGQNAIILAKNDKWQELMDYCMSDVMLTYELFQNIDSNFNSLIKISDNCWISWSIRQPVKEVYVHLHLPICKNYPNLPGNQENKEEKKSLVIHHTLWKECSIAPTEYLCTSM